jgi:YVTN family beta-propeller protein
MHRRNPSLLLSFLTTVSVAVSACGHDEHGGPPGSVPITAVQTDAVYVINGGDATITVIDAQSNAVLGTIALENMVYPHHIYQGAAGSRLLVAAIGEDLSGGHDHKRGVARHGEVAQVGAMLVLDGATGATVVGRTFAHGSHNAIYAPDESAIWTAQLESPGQVLVLNPTTLELVDTIDVGNMPLEVTFGPAGQRAFVVCNEDDSVTVIDVATRAVETTITVGDGPVGAWPGGDGKMYVDNELSKSLTVIDGTTLTVERTITLGFTPGYAATAPGNAEVWVTDADGGKVVFFSTADGSKTGELATGANAHAIAFSADGTRAWVTNQDADDVSVIDVAQKTVIATVPVGDAPNGALFRDAP